MCETLNEQLSEQVLLAIHAEMLEKYGEDVAQEVTMILLDRQPENPWHYARKIGHRVATSLKFPHRETQEDGTEKRVNYEVQGYVDRAIDTRFEELVHLNIDEPQRVQSHVNGTERKAECHPKRRHESGGLCKPCYEKQRRGDVRVT